MNMNRIQSLFGRKQNNLLSVYFTAGFPRRELTAAIINELAAQGADMIEVGVPFSDPMADGVVIQHSSSIALKNGMTLDLLLNQVAEARKTSRDIPLILMGYLNPMIQYGIENLFKRCKEVGIDGLIIPDLPFAEYMAEYKGLCEHYDLPMIMLITPETSDERIHLIDDNCSGFIYMVSSASTTGTKDRFNDEQLDYFKRISHLDLKHERLIGFGISNPTTFNEACSYASGGIIGSLFIKCLERNEGSISAAVSDLLATIGRK
jgi:tryptophan synthase alpha chain